MRCRRNITKKLNLPNSGIEAGEDGLVRELDEQGVNESHGDEEQTLDHDGQPEEDGHGQEAEDAAEDGVLRQRAPTVAVSGRQTLIVKVAVRIHGTGKL